jgi:AcrR family transcriptional regulator
MTDAQTSADDRIVDAALTLIAERGLGGVTMTEIAARAGVARQTLYNHYPDVDSIVVAVLDRHAADSLARVTALIGTADSADAKLELLVRHTVAAAAHGHPAADFQAGLSPPARATIEEHGEAARGLIASILEEGVAGGTFLDTVDPNAYAYLVQATLLGGVDLAVASGDQAEAATLTTEMILRSLR